MCAGQQPGSVEVLGKEPFHLREYVEAVLLPAQGFISERQFHVSSVRGIRRFERIGQIAAL